MGTEENSGLELFNADIIGANVLAGKNPVNPKLRRDAAEKIKKILSIDEKFDPEINQIFGDREADMKEKVRGFEDGFKNEEQEIGA